MDRINCPKVEVTALTAFPDANQVQQRNLCVAAACDKGIEVYQKFESLFQPGGSLHRQFLIFEAFTILNPCTFHNMGVGPLTVAYVDTIVTLSGLQLVPNIRNLLIAELPIYFANSANIDNDVDVIAYWYSMRNTLPNWYHYVIPEAVIFQPTSCAAERVFAMLKWMFGDDQEAALEDYKEASLMMRYNEAARMHLDVNHV